MASGINNTFRQVGIATGVAALGAIFQARIHSHLAAALAGTPAEQHVDRLTRAAASGSVGRVLGSVPRQARGQLAAAARAAFVSGLNRLFLISAALAFLGALLALALVRSSDFEQHEDAEDETGPPERESAPARRQGVRRASRGRSG
jgi:hypothetical protein